jgi:hypothetical protein
MKMMTILSRIENITYDDFGRDDYELKNSWYFWKALDE